MEPQKSTYERVLRMFKHYGCSEQTLLARPKLLQILNKQAAINLHRKFSPTIIDEMWGQTETNTKGQTTVLTFCKIFSQAMAILEDRIGIIDGPTGIMQKEAQLKVQQNKLKQLETQYQQGFETNYDKINVVRKNITMIEGKIKELKNNRGEFHRDLSEMQGVLDFEERPPTIERSEYIAQSRLEESMSPPAPSPHLSLIFKVTVLAILLQFLFFNFRQSFLAVLCYFFIVYWLFLGYYDQNFVKVIIAGLGISCVMDLVFACLQIMGKVGNYQHPQNEKVWMYISTVFIIVQIALRVLLLIKLCLFREPNAKRQYFQLFGHEIELNARSGKMFSSQKSFD